MLSAFDVSVFCPSPTEGAPRAVILGMLASRPCLSTGAEGVADMITPEFGGITSPENDPASLRALLERFLEDPARGRAGGRARHAPTPRRPTRRPWSHRRSRTLRARDRRRRGSFRGAVLSACPAGSWAAPMLLDRWGLTGHRARCGHEARRDPRRRRRHAPAPLHDGAAQAADADRRSSRARHRRAPAQGARLRADHDRHRLPGRADRGLLPRRRGLRDPDRLLPRARAAGHRRRAGADRGPGRRRRAGDERRRAHRHRLRRAARAPPGRATRRRRSPRSSVRSRSRWGCCASATTPTPPA